MLATLESATVIGVDACRVDVQIDVSLGLPHFQLVGLPDASVRESRDRVRAAIRNSGFDFPVNRITINLAPGDLRKAGPTFDLPIALGMLAATGVVQAQQAPLVPALAVVASDVHETVVASHPDRSVLVR